MDTNPLFTAALGLVPPWRVERSNFNAEQVIDPQQAPKVPSSPANSEAIHLTPQTRYWRDGKRVNDPALTVGLFLRCNTFGTASGSDRYAEDVVFDDQSLEQCFIAPQHARQLQRVTHDGYPGYVQNVAVDDLTVLMFRDVAKLAEQAFAIGAVVRVKPLLWSGQAGAEPVTATVSDSRRAGLGWQVHLRGAFSVADWPETHTAVVYTSSPQTP
jgi:hypothetical protein